MARNTFPRRKTFTRDMSDPHHSPLRECAGMDTEFFFPLSESGVREAQQVCEVCPVLARCAAWALREGFTDGVIASVKMPAHQSDQWQARRRLEQVAATGRPVTDGKAVA
ncbi:WhiB family transcriptional regulator [Nocardia sp. NPDC056100]|uniref:WhiB family transcriptional regulator n=1 Tax=Nocardia sp. NPDC056100 TaxID=3345712 RepID=UPI0035E1F48E